MRVAGLTTGLGEGPLWDAARGLLWLVDIMAHRVLAHDPVSGATRAFDVGQPVGAVALAADDLVCAVRDGFGRLDPVTGAFRLWVPVEADNPRTRMNDGYVDARGRFWAGTMSLHRERERGALYRLDPDGTVTCHLSGVTTSNGIDWSADQRRMYYVDTGHPRIDVFDFDVDAGTIANRRSFVTIDPAEGKPDGLVVDAEDHVWLALWRGGRVIRFAPDGTRVATIDLPSPLTTKPAFGGEDLRDLYVTSARESLSAEELATWPDAGGLFRLRLTVAGRPPQCFGLSR
jgi:sugar lactone lactonase YvrE